MAVLKASGELGVKEEEVCWFLGRTVKMPSSSSQYKQNILFRLIEWLVCILAKESIHQSGSFIICWREFSVNQVRWPISMAHLVEYENSPAIWDSDFFLPSIILLYLLQ